MIHAKSPMVEKANRKAVQSRLGLILWRSGGNGPELFIFPTRGESALPEFDATMIDLVIDRCITIG